VHTSGQRLDIERLGVFAVHSIADAPQPSEVAQALRIGGSTGHS
jgi:hypothetical protein